MSGPSYGTGDATFQAAGGEIGVRTLVDHFYTIMKSEHPRIFDWHSGDLATTKDKLARFLCGWIGGPRIYQEKYGSISIPGVHAHLGVDTDAKEQWLTCMSKALAKMDYPADFVEYLLTQLAIPAEHVRRVANESS